MQLDISNNEYLKSLIKNGDRLLIYQEITDREIFKQYINLLKALEKRKKQEILDNYYRLCSLLLEYNELNPGSISADLWQNFVLDIVLSNENILIEKVTQKRNKMFFQEIFIKYYFQERILG